jgi:hypothetical protein
MRNVDFYSIVQDVLEDCITIMREKGDAYAGEGQDKFANFNRLADKLGLDMKKIWQVYFQKHIDAIESFLREEYHDPEPIEGRIKDAINYLLILYGMIKEKQ